MASRGQALYGLGFGLDLSIAERSSLVGNLDGTVLIVIQLYNSSWHLVHIKCPY